MFTSVGMCFGSSKTGFTFDKNKKDFVLFLFPKSVAKNFFFINLEKKKNVRMIFVRKQK
jgi:hypothetical protein